jgi:hypothetical protein
MRRALRRALALPFILAAVLVALAPAGSASGGYPPVGPSVIYLPAVFGQVSTPPTPVPPTATPTRTPTPVVSTPTPTTTPGGGNLLLDPSFEQGFTYWTPGGYAALSNFAHSGALSVWLGGYDNADDAVYQTVVIPGCATAGTISYWLFPISTGTRAGLSDKVRVSLVDTSSFANIYVGDNWVAPTQYGPWTFRQDAINAVSQYAGHSAFVSIVGTTDSSYWSEWYFDDAALTFTC